MQPVTALDLRVLGPVQVSRGGAEVDLGTFRQRQVVAALALAEGRPVSTAQLIDHVWIQHPPPSAISTLHGYVAILRRALEPDRQPRETARVLVRVDDGYALRVPRGDRDDARFEALTSRARQLLHVVGDHLRPRAAPADRESVESALDLLDEALRLWRGEPYAELGDGEDATARRLRLSDLRASAIELRVVGRLALGANDLVRAELQENTTRYPLHERWSALHAVALAREARQAEALEVLASLRDNLVEELGVDLSPAVQELHTAILRQDPSVSAVVGESHPSPRLPTATAPRWSTVGRTAQQQLITDTLASAAVNGAVFLALTGEPGIGKTRVVDDLVDHARSHGWRTARSGATQDDAAPPLWPWRSVIAQLGGVFPDPADLPEVGGEFWARAEMAEVIREAANQQPVVVVVEDLHWADASTLRLIRHLAETLTDEPLMVVTTWRSGTTDSAELAATVAAMLRRHAVRIDLDAVAADAVGEIFEAVSGLRLDISQRRALHVRTGGNPFFVVELARLAARDGDIGSASLAGSDQIPATVLEMILLRVDSMPAATVSLLRSAAVIGTAFDLATLAEASGRAPDEVIDSLDPAMTAGLVTETAVEHFEFAHALVREALRQAMSSTRLARAHRDLAHMLTGRPGREAEVVWHWRAAGATHRPQLWRALRSAALASMSTMGYAEAGVTLREALDIQQADSTSDPSDRIGLLMALISACRGAANLPMLVAAVEHAIEVADQLGDLVAKATAATQPGRWTMWRSASFGSVNRVVVEALREVIEELPADEVELAARARVSLANELRDQLLLDQRVELCREAVSMARTLDDDAVLVDVLKQAALAIGHPDTGVERLRMADEAVQLAGAGGDRYQAAMALTLQTVVQLEMGQIDRMRQSLTAARTAAEGLHVPYAVMLLDEIEAGWCAAAGDTEGCHAALDRMHRSVSLLDDSGGGDKELALSRYVDIFAMLTWREEFDQALADIDRRIADGFPMAPVAAVVLCRAGALARARERFSAAEMADVLDLDLPFAAMVWSQVAEAAFHFDDSDLARRARVRLEPLAGRLAGADGLIYGPVDAYVALACLTAGDRAAAVAHADEATALIRDWGLTRVGLWFDGLRRDRAF